MKNLVSIFTFLVVANISTAQCKGSYKDNVQTLLEDYYYDNSAQIDVVNRKAGILMEYEFTLFRKPYHLFGIDASDLPEGGFIKIYKRKSRKESVEVYDSRRKGNPETIKFKPESDSRKYMIEVMVPAGSDSGCILVALGYKMESDLNIANQPKKKKRRIRIVD